MPWEKGRARRRMTRSHRTIRMNAISSESEVEEQEPRTTFAWLLGTFFGIGFIRPGSGTWASACTAALWWAAGYFFIPGGVQWFYTTAAACVVIVVGIPVSSIVARESGVKDPGHVVIDEVAGQLISMILVPLLC